VLRDENEELMKLFLTNKKKSIPIVIVVDKATGSVLGKWGPRPKGATDLITDYKMSLIDETAKANLQYGTYTIRD
jgi:hypothetical protein